MQRPSSETMENTIRFRDDVCHGVVPVGVEQLLSPIVVTALAADTNARDENLVPTVSQDLQHDRLWGRIFPSLDV